MQPPMIHGRQSSTFSSPPLDAKMTLPEMYDWNYRNSARHPLFVYEEESGNATTITWGQAVPAMRRISKIIGSQLTSLKSDEPQDSNIVIGVLASLDTITYFCLLVGVLRMGWTVFPMSPRNNAEVITELLEKSKATHLIVSSDATMQNLATTSVENLEGRNIPILKAPTFQDLFPLVEESEKQDKHTSAPIILDIDGSGAILHSSGTTGNPKPVRWTHRALRQFALHPCYGDVDLAGKIMSIHAMGMYHGIGMLQVAFVATTGLVLSMFKPRSPLIVPDPVNVIEEALRTKSDFIYCAPTFIETWSRSGVYVDELARLDGIFYGGGPLNKDVGDTLASKGVKIGLSYGSTQCGRLSKFYTEPLEHDWEYFEFVDYTEPHFVPDGHGAYEVIILETDDFTPCVINCEINGKKGYATNDLVERHPSKENYWRIVGRTDDQIMHSTGLKTNPRPLEKILEEDPRIRSALIFGRGQLTCGLLVQPASEYIFDINDTSKANAFIQTIWPTVQKVNQRAPYYSKLFKEMILVASPNKPFIFNSKGSPKRDTMLAAYDDEIIRLYSTASDILPGVGPGTWDLASTISFIRDAVENVMGVERIPVDDDLFSTGCDSLHATWIRNTILTALRKAHTDVTIPVNVVYQYSSISSLAAFISGKVEHKSDNSIDANGQSSFNGETSSAESKAHVQNVADEYVGKLIAAASAVSPIERTRNDCIILTGSSGSLGVNLLSQMIKDVGIGRIYALSRKSEGISLLEKHATAFRKAGLDETALKSNKLVLLSADLAFPGFGMDSNILAEMRSSVTHIVHNGWRVDFNANLRSFESCLKGVINLISFAIGCETRTLPRFIFVSSVGVVHDSPGSEPVIEEAIRPDDCPSSSGYSESKWIAERLLIEGTVRAGLRPIIVRLGQLAGCDNGAWNTKEWFPSLIKSSVNLGLIPNVRGSVSWLSCSTVASIILEIRDSFEPILHVVHPAGVPWSEIINEFSERLKLRVVPYETWLSSLERSGHNASEHGVFDEDLLRASPAFQLLAYFQHADVTSPGREQLGARLLSTAKAVKESPTLRSPTLPRFSGVDVDKWLSFWYASGFLSRGQTM